MPSSTFFRLPAEKREKLLQCAREEFGRVAFPDVSINRIIRTAQIPRGSFYMYFTDKADLFFYLLNTYADQLEQQIGTLLDREKGNLFAAFLGLFDYVQEASRIPGDPCVELVHILARNTQIQPAVLMRDMPPQCRICNLKARIDLSLLELHNSGDLAYILQILMGITGAAIIRASKLDDPAPVREQLSDTVRILKRGMAKKPMPAED